VSGEAARRLLGLACCLLFFAAALALAALFLLSFVPFENTDPPSVFQQVGVGLLTLAFVVASVGAGGYARNPTLEMERRAVIRGAIAIVPLIVWLFVSAIQS
jgi:hypothetical protein